MHANAVRSASPRVKYKDEKVPAHMRKERERKREGGGERESEGEREGTHTHTHTHTYTHTNTRHRAQATRGQDQHTPATPPTPWARLPSSSVPGFSAHARQTPPLSPRLGPAVALPHLLPPNSMLDGGLDLLDATVIPAAPAAGGSASKVLRKLPHVHQHRAPRQQADEEAAGKKLVRWRPCAAG